MNDTASTPTRVVECVMFGNDRLDALDFDLTAWAVTDGAEKIYSLHLTKAAAAVQAEFPNDSIEVREEPTDAPYVITDANGDLLDRFLTEEERDDALHTGEYPDDAEPAYVNDPTGSLFGMGTHTYRVVVTDEAGTVLYSESVEAESVRDAVDSFAQGVAAGVL